ncbi:MAG: hypothetical protein H6739_24655 [Alphaproteobacteria bacterium]|nr:hypothetical protein [Alphaproteobacteria bacterium]
MAPDLEALWQQHRDAGFTAITALRGTDDPDDVQYWIDQLGLTFPVLDDTEEIVWDEWRDGNARPQYILMDRELEIVLHGEGREGHEAAEEAIPGLL